MTRLQTQRTIGQSPSSEDHRNYTGWRLPRLVTRLGALCLVLGLLVWIASSAPHLVHHLDDPHQLADCLPFSLANHFSVVKGAAWHLPIPLWCGEESSVVHWLPTVATTTCPLRSRAPPA